jgi:hypothetical protein
MKTVQTKKGLSNYLVLTVVVVLALQVYSVSAGYSPAYNLVDSLNNVKHPKTAIEKEVFVFAHNYNMKSELTSANKKMVPRLTLFAEEFEEEILLEDWMLDPGHGFWTNNFREESEEEIDLEDWMMDLSKW